MQANFASPPHREPPANLEAEQALLGAILVNNRAFDAVADLLEPEHFAQGVHGRIYAAARAMIERGDVANPVTLKHLFDQDGSLADVGGSAYLVQLATSTVTTGAHTGDYGRTIHDCWLRRELIGQASETIERAYGFDLEGSGRDILEQAESALYRLGDTRAGGAGPIHVARASFDHMGEVDAAYKAGGKPMGLQTGLADLDRLIGGLQPQELIVLGGRPSMGKSLIAGRIGWNVARQGDGTNGVLIFSLEQATRLWVARWIASTTQISTDRQYVGQLDHNEWDRFVGADQHLRALPLWIDEAAGLTIGQVRHRARRLARRHAVKLIVVDHLGLMRASKDAEREGKTARVSELSRDLKNLAKELGIPVLALSQLSRGVEGRDDKRPNLSDLRDSGTIEQDADVVIFAYRHHYYLERAAPTRRQGEAEGSFLGREADHAAELERTRHALEMIVAKNRHGRVGTARLFYDGESCVVTDLHRGAGSE